MAGCLACSSDTKSYISGSTPTVRVSFVRQVKRRGTRINEGLCIKPATHPCKKNYKMLEEKLDG